MSIYEHLNENQIDGLIALIRDQCNRAARNDRQFVMRIPEELRLRLQKGRKAHDITADIYIAAFIADNQIGGIQVEPVSNGIYTMPEFTANDTIIHIYHYSNKLNSQLIRTRANDENINFFCMIYKMDEQYRLEYVESVYLDGDTKIKEILYEAPDINMQAG